MVSKTQNRTELMRQVDKRRIYAILSNKSERFKDLLNELRPLSKSYVSFLLKELQKEGTADKDIENGAPVWILTKKGKDVYRNSWTMLQENISNMMREGGGYLHSSDRSWSYPLMDKNSPENLYLYMEMDLIEFPGELSSYLNSVKVQYNLKEYVVKEVLKEIKDKNIEKLPDNSKVILSFEVNLSNYQMFLKKIGRFVEDIKNDVDVFSDKELEISNSQNKLAFVEAYLDNAVLVNDIINDKAYIKKLDAISHDKKFISRLVNAADVDNVVDINTLKQFIQIFKAGNDPLDNQNLTKRLIIPIKVDGKPGFIEPFYDYISLSRILNPLDKTLREKLNEYEHRNKWNLAESKVNRIVMGSHPRHKNNYKHEKNGTYRCKDCGTGFLTLEQYEIHNCNQHVGVTQ